jgi:hypothetical protein
MLHVSIYREVEKYELQYFEGLAVTHIHGVTNGKFAVHVLRLNHGQVQVKKVSFGVPDIKILTNTISASRLEAALPLCYEIEARFIINDDEGAAEDMNRFRVSATRWDATRVHVKTMYDYAWRKYAMAHTIKMAYYNQVATSHGIITFLNLRDMKFW